MGIDVALMRVAQHGTSPRRRQLTPLATVTDEGDLLAREFTTSRTPMLSRADPYRDLILSSAEMEQFIEEAGSLIAGADDACEARIHRVLDLARRCRDEPDTELHLQGD